MFKKIAIVTALFSVSLFAHSQNDLSSEVGPPAQVMLLGTFHFQDAGSDTVKATHIDVMSSASQDYIDQLTRRIATEFNPTKVLLEFEPSRDSVMQTRYQAFIEGEFELPANEIYQLGFRIAQRSDAETIHGFDDREIGWNAGPLFEVLESHYPERNQAFQRQLHEFTEATNRRHREMNLQELLTFYNQRALDDANMQLYVDLNDIDFEGGKQGANAASSWWHRNFRMYANIQNAAQPGERVLVISGQGHNAIFKQLILLDPVRQSVPVASVLSE